jgi:TldD protein
VVSDFEPTIDRLLSLISSSPSSVYSEVRYQMRSISEIHVTNGEVERVRDNVVSGCGIRVLVDGCWGFSSTNDTTTTSLKSSMRDAISVARVLGNSKKAKVRGLAECKLAKGVFRAKERGRLSDVGIERKVKDICEAEAQARKHRGIRMASCTYREIIDHKLLVTSDGAEAEIYDPKPEFAITCLAGKGTESVSSTDGVGITGGWYDLFSKKSNTDYAEEVADKAYRLLDAKYPHGERTTLILDPGMVGLLAHEAIGHMAEADFVLSGSVLKGKIGQTVASDLVTLVDNGHSAFAKNAAGTIAVDDEGVYAGRTSIIKDGVLESFLHSRESAMVFDSEPAGNARAFSYTDEPLIRMRNTYIEPKSDKLADMIKETGHGFLVKGARNGQADANGEFMFGSQEVYLVENGEVKQIMRGTSVSGNAFEVLQSVDMVGDSFEYGIGTGYCGKYQPAKVDGGGPYLRCSAIIGGTQ